LQSSNPSDRGRTCRARRGDDAGLPARARPGRLCRLPDETIHDFQDAGFFKILQPCRYGGYEMDPQTFYAVQMKVAEGCMSSAWVLGVARPQLAARAVRCPRTRRRLGF
jgi:alkylation response protein AidB-like acyl-CoA dehydrogenase